MAKNPNLIRQSRAFHEIHSNVVIGRNGLKELVQDIDGVQQGT